MLSLDYDNEKWQLSVFHSILLQLPECSRVNLKFLAESIMTLCENDRSVELEDNLTHVARCFAPVVCPIDTDCDAKEEKLAKEKVTL